MHLTSLTKASRLKPALAMLLLASLYINQVSAQANDILEVSLRAGNESNVPRGVDVDHEIGSAFIGADVFAGRYFQLGLYNSVTLGAQLSTTRFTELSGFDHLGAGLSADLTHKFGLGAYVPVVQFNLAWDLEYYRGRARDNERWSARLDFSQRLSPAWLIELGLDTTDNDNRSSLPMDPAVTAFGYDPDIALPYEFYDFQSRSAYVGAQYTFENLLTLTARYRRTNGHTVASTTEPTLKTYKIARAFYSDPAFASDWFAYLLESNSHGFSTVLSLPLGPDTGLDFSADWQEISAPAGKNYDNEIYSVVVSWRF